MTVRHIIVDGYNVVRTAARYAEQAERDFDKAREALIADVAAYVGPEDHGVVVFDGARNPESTGELQPVAGIDVVFSAYGMDADGVIEDLVAQYRRAREPVVLVTSDQTMQWTALGPTVTRRSSREFADELVEEHLDRLEHAEEGRRATVRDRIGEDVRATLERWARRRPHRGREDASSTHEQGS